METLIVQTRDKGHLDMVVKVLKAMDAKVKVLKQTEILEDKFFGKLMEKGDKGDFLTKSEQDDFLAKLSMGILK